jgi:hypothetical protein
MRKAVAASLNKKRTQVPPPAQSAAGAADSKSGWTDLIRVETSGNAKVPLSGFECRNLRATSLGMTAALASTRR